MRMFPFICVCAWACFYLFVCVCAHFHSYVHVITKNAIKIALKWDAVGKFTATRLQRIQEVEENYNGICTKVAVML